MFLVITGGSGSGKSAYAEQCVLDFGPAERIYIATMYPFDEECDRRIRRHREMRRQKQFFTLECYTGLKKADIPENSVVLLECMSNLTANEMSQPDGAGENTPEAVIAGVEKLSRSVRNLVVVTNEVFSDGFRYDPDTLRYLEYLGDINCRMAEMADQVTEVVYGIPVTKKRKVQTDETNL